MLLMIVSFLFSTHSMAAPRYTLAEICGKYGTFGQCSYVPFCREINETSGCKVAPNAPAHMEGICKIQSQQFCAILEAQGNCVWTNGGTSCKAVVDEL